nr:hypothetical protein [Natrinema caseinilyticum]
MIGRFEDPFRPSVTRTTLYRVVGWLLWVYVVSLLVVGVYSVLWIFEIAGVLPGRWLSTAWIGVPAIGSVFLVLLIPLYYAGRSNDR